MITLSMIARSRKPEVNCTARYHAKLAARHHRDAIARHSGGWYAMATDHRDKRNYHVAQMRAAINEERAYIECAAKIHGVAK